MKGYLRLLRKNVMCSLRVIAKVNYESPKSQKIHPWTSHDKILKEYQSDRTYILFEFMRLAFNLLKILNSFKSDNATEVVR